MMKNIYQLLKVLGVKHKQKTNKQMKKFISQTAADDNGNYTITYIDHNDLLITKTMNLFNF